MIYNQGYYIDVLVQDCGNSSANALELPQSCLNSLAPGGFENIFQNVFFKLISWIDTLSNSCETVLRRMPQNPSDDKSTLVQVMAWCRQATSHYLSQCCPRSLSPYGVTRPQWVKPSSCSIPPVLSTWTLVSEDNIQCTGRTVGGYILHLSCVIYVCCLEGPWQKRMGNNVEGLM